MNLLIQVWTLTTINLAKFDRFTARRRLVKRANYPNVGEAFRARWLRIFSRQHTVRKIEKFGSELVTPR